jgi:cytochrome P450/NADPH-cytochrome P450 reductase
MVGNLFDLNAANPVQDMMQLARRRGPIFQLELPGRSLIVISGHDLVDELSDERRFDKVVWAPLRNVRSFTGDGLFTSWTQEPNWRRAHNILLPSFSMQAMRGYMPMMVDIAEQLARKWERLNPDDEIDVPADMTRLTLDTIGLCGFDYRFNSFYREEPHPFIVSMVCALGESLEQLHRLPGQTKLMVRTRRRFHDDISEMNALVDKIIRERKAAGPERDGRQDLLSHMLAGVDKQSGEGLDDLTIRYQIITFLIAGHETTSGLLSFTLYFLLKHPEVLAKAYDEVDRVLGSDLGAAPTYAQVTKLHYITQVLNESLRLWPTAPAFALSPFEPTTLGGKYAVDKRSELMVLAPMLHRDPSVWGEDAEEFNPEHFSPEAERSRSANAFKPFGNGQRACIGRQFAMQEAALVLGMLLQRFELIDTNNYQLKIKETLTLKPEDFRIRARPRTSRPIHIPTAEMSVLEAEVAPTTATPAAGHNTPLLVLYGSNLGTAEGIANTLVEDGRARGFATTVAPLDDYVENLPKDGAVLIVSASYNGTAPDNAARFCAWLSDEAPATDALAGVRYAVFGCGNRDWASTYQAVPTLIDEQLGARGAARIYARGEGDARDDFDGQLREWYGPLWSVLTGALGLAGGGPNPAVKGHRYEAELVGEQAIPTLVLEYGAQSLRVLANRELLRKDGPHPAERSTRHIEMALPEGMTYKPGDHLGVLPRNGELLVRRARARFRFGPEARIRIHSNTGSKTNLPLDTPVTVADLLATTVELQDVATRAQIALLAEYTECPPEKAQLLALAGDDAEGVARYREEVLARHVSLLDLLERFQSCILPFNIYLEQLVPLRPRYYSISSSPLTDPHRCSITVGVVAGPARSGQGDYAGVCSSYLSGLEVGSTVAGFVRDSNTPFRLPEDPRTPLILVGGGTGLAPYRGFLRERALLRARGMEVGPSLLFFGCRHPEQDVLYEEELRELAAQGLVSVYPAFSRLEGRPKRYVQDEILAQANAVWRTLEGGAAIYVCGDAGKMAPEVRRAFAEVYRQQAKASEAEAETLLAQLTLARRYVVDVWPSN